jgi:outer membrane protein assembly factor BamB
MKPSLLLTAAALALLSQPSFAAAKKSAKAEKAAAPAASTPGVTGWLSWRGPDQNGTSRETGLPDKIEVKSALWTADFPGQSAPVIANGKLYINGFLGDGPDLQEVISCFDAETGKLLWDHRFNDFLSDTIYLRYATSSPSVDPETGNVYMQGTQGIFACFTADGKKLWEHSMMEEFGRMTFPNARTASPVIDKELVITRGITSNWGASGPAGDRFYAFDKKTGELVWSSTPGERPQDNTFSTPLLTWVDGKRVLISASGDSSVVGMNARTGDPLFRFPAAKAGAKGGINASVLRYKDSLIVIHESENLDSSEVGRSAAFKLPQGIKPAEPGKPAQFLAKDLELWRNPSGNLASSPCLVGNRMYQVNGVGEVVAVNADTGTILWKKKVAAEQRQSSPFFAEGKLYVAVYIAGQGGAPAEEGVGGGGNGELYVLKPGEKDAEVLSRTGLEGRCYGSPIAYNGKLYLQTDRKLYCFGKKGENKGLAAAPAPEPWPKAGPAAKLQIIPNEAFLQPGEGVALRFRALDANGFTVEESVDPKSVKVETFIPPTALVKATMKGSYVDGKLVADKEPAPSAGAWMASRGELKGVMRGRVLPALPIKQDFESFDLAFMTGPGPGGTPAPVAETTPAATPAAGAPPAAKAPAAPPPQGPTVWNVIEPPTPFNYPPLPWNAARFRFEIRKAPGDGENKALCKSIDHKLFQRGQIFIGHPWSKNYTVEADVLTEGNRRKMSEVGLINQRYLIILKGNAQQMEVSSNQERIRASVPFKWSPNEWYRLKTRVDIAADGSGVIRGKAWKKGEPEPEGWNIEVPHKNANTHGCPGFFAFTPQEQRAWLDNITVTPNTDSKTASN